MNPRLVKQFTVKVCSIIESHYFEVVCLSQNNIFILFNFDTYSYLTENYKQLELFDEIVQSACFSHDSKYLAMIFMYSQILILYNLIKQQKIVQKKIKTYFDSKLLFFGNQLITINSNYIITVSLLGKIKKIHLYDKKEKLTQLLLAKLNDKLLICIKALIRNLVQKVLIFSTQSFRVINTFITADSVLELKNLTHHLIIQIPEKENFCFKLIDLTNTKIVRKIRAYGKVYETIIGIQKKSVVNFDLYCFRENQFYRINFLKGQITNKRFKFPGKFDGDCYQNQLQQPFFYRKSWENIFNKNSKKEEVKLKLYKFVI